MRCGPVDPKECFTCKNTFTPKFGGYSAKYCSKKCKRKSQRRWQHATPELRRAARRRSYEYTKSRPDAYAKHVSSNRSSASKTRKWLADYKQNSGCVDCGYRAFPCALQMDHNGVKTIDIAEARSSIGRLLLEFEKGKCVVRCANCHSIKTWAEKRGLVYPLEIIPVSEVA